MRIFNFEIKRVTAVSRTAPRSEGDGWHRIFETFPGAWQRNVEPASRETLLAFSAVYAAVSMISNDIAKLRLKLMNRDTLNGISSEAPDASPFVRVLRRPNRNQTPLQFISNWMLSKLMHGNTYALKQRDGRGMVEALYILDPRYVTPLVADDGSVFYRLQQDNLSGIVRESVDVPAAEIIHDRMTALWHPLVGISPITACAASATQGSRIQWNSAAFFENLSRPSGMLVAPGDISDETAARLKKHWEDSFGGANAGRTAVLGDGLKYEAMAIPAHDAQLIEQLRWTVEDVARAFQLPLHRLGAGPAPSLANLESFEGQYYSTCLQVHIESLEQCLDRGLELPSNLSTECDLRGLLRMDTGSRYEALSKAVGAGWMAPNEARRLEDLEPVSGGDSPYLQQQNFSLEALARRDSQEGAPALDGASAKQHSGLPDPRFDALIKSLPEEARLRFQLATVRKTLGLPDEDEGEATVAVESILEAATAKRSEHSELSERLEKMESILKSVGVVIERVPARLEVLERLAGSGRR